MSEFFSVIGGRLICNACNALSTFKGEHRCFRDHEGVRCQCPDPLCRMARGEVTLAELETDNWDGRPVAPVIG